MIILDTSFLVSFYNTRDCNHIKAVNIMKEIISERYGRAGITDFIFGECATILLMRTKSLKETAEIGEKIKALESFEADKETLNLAWNIFKNQKNTQLSFTDCSIIATMKQENIVNIATFDKDFLKIKGIDVIH